MTFVLLIAALVSSQVEVPAAHDSAGTHAMPEWVGKRPYWEADTYVVPVASGYRVTANAPTEDGGASADAWEKWLKEVAVTELEQAVLAVVVSPHPVLRGLGHGYWESLYEKVEHRIWGPERFLEKARVPNSSQVRYQMHGLIRLDPTTWSMISNDLERATGSNASWRSAFGSNALVMNRDDTPSHPGSKSVVLVHRPIRRGHSRAVIIVIPIALLAAALAAYLLYRWPRQTLGVGAIGAILFWLFFVMSVGEVYDGDQDVVMNEPLRSEEPASVSSKAITIAKVAPADGAGTAETVIELEKAAEAKPPKTQANTDAGADADADAKGDTDANSPPRPDWVNEQPQLKDGVYRRPVASGLFATVAECQRALPPKIKAAIDEYVEELIDADASARVRLDEPFIQSLQKATYTETRTTASVGPMQQMHVLLEFDDASRARIQALYQRSLLAGRLGYVSVAAASVLAVLGIAFGYLKLDTLTGGQIRGRLRLAAMAAILLVATSGAIACQALQWK